MAKTANKKTATHQPVIEDHDLEVEVVEPEDEHHDPDTEIGLVDNHNIVSYTDMPTQGRQREILINGRRYEHTHEDRDGVWIYRDLG